MKGGWDFGGGWMVAAVAVVVICKKARSIF